MEKDEVALIRHMYKFTSITDPLLKHLQCKQTKTIELNNCTLITIHVCLLFILSHASCSGPPHILYLLI